MIPLGQTTESQDHIHTITNAASGYTDPGIDGHRHKLIRGCAACAKIRKGLHIEVLPTALASGHVHFFNTGSL
jgi:hypothetical protein